MSEDLLSKIDKLERKVDTVNLRNKKAINDFRTEFLKLITDLREEIVKIGENFNAEQHAIRQRRINAINKFKSE